jgi:hypothetical protein
MKNQYFGDVNDYRKYGLLRTLAKGNINILISWMLSPNDGSADGKCVQYLNDPNRWRSYDPELFDAIHEEVMVNNRRDVACVGEQNLIRNASFVEAMLDGLPAARSSWLTEMRQKRSNMDLVFFDPDNGIEVPSAPKTRRNSKKYIYWEELRETWESGLSLLVYQHFCREKRDLFIERLSDEFKRRLGSFEVHAIRTAHVIFFLVPQPQHSEILAERVQYAAEHWHAEIHVKKV